MALPPITLTEHEPIRLIAPSDPAIDLDQTPPDELDAYISGNSPDVSTLTLRQGVEPTWFTVRALSPREMRAVRSRLLEGSDEDETPMEHMVRIVEMTMQFCRFGLVDVEGWDGWQDAKRAPFLGMKVWPEDTIAAMPDDVLMYLGGVVIRLSSLDEKKSAPATSSRGRANGTAKRRSTAGAPARGRSTAKRARKTRSAGRS